MLSFQGNGTKADTAALQDQLTGALIGLARATEGNDHMLRDSTAAVTVEGLLATLPDANFDNAALLAMMDKVDAEKRKLIPACYECASSCGRNNAYDMQRLRNADKETRALKLSILCGIRDVAACARSGCWDESIPMLLYRALFAIGMEDWGTEELLPILQEVDKVKRKASSD